MFAVGSAFAPVRLIGIFTARSETLATARQILGRMPEDLASAVAYYYCDEMSHEEIAKVMGCSRRHVGNLIERAQGWAEENVA